MENISDMFARGAQRLIHDTHYVAYVFKKTEKICNAVYFISSNITDVSNGQNNVHNGIVREVETSALALLGKVQATLSRTSDELPAIAPSLSIGILDLGSKLGILAATGKLARDHLNVFQQELDTLERAIYFHEPDRALTPLRTKSAPALKPTAFTTPKNVIPKVATAPKKEQPTSLHAALTNALPREQVALTDTTSRGQLIRDVLLKTPASSIKDISRAFPDVSEKTVQREVNTLIEQGVVHKEGAKRWSRYSLVRA